MRERSHSEKREPRVLRTSRWKRHVSQRPAGGAPRSGTAGVGTAVRVSSERAPDRVTSSPPRCDNS